MKFDIYNDIIRNVRWGFYRCFVHVITIGDRYIVKPLNNRYVVISQCQLLDKPS